MAAAPTEIGANETAAKLQKAARTAKWAFKATMLNK